jgi:hypothetical protein
VALLLLLAAMANSSYLEPVFSRAAYQVGIPVHRDHPFRFIVTSDSGFS